MVKEIEERIKYLEVILSRKYGDIDDRTRKKIEEHIDLLRRMLVAMDFY